MLKHAAVYVVLVGLPVAGLVWILRVGKTYRAAPHLEGEWSIADHACVGDSSLRLETQSGRFLRFDGETVQLDAEGRLVAEWTLPSGPCAGRRGQLRLTPDDARERLEGTLAVDCDACLDGPLTAARALAETDAARATGH